LRIDNADERLMPIAERYRLLDAPLRDYRDRLAASAARLEAVVDRRLDAGAAEKVAAAAGIPIGSGPHTAATLVRAGLGAQLVAGLLPDLQEAGPEALEKLEVRLRYAGYVERQAREVAAARRWENSGIPEDLSYAGIRGLSTESMQKLERLRPRTLGQASRIDGVRAGDLALLMVHLERHRRQRHAVEA
jgi:tRNA uridine 5-carboxymethylaminomethyl modification enzyme